VPIATDKEDTAVTKDVQNGIVLLALALGLAGCGGGADSASAPSPVQPSVPVPQPGDSAVLVGATVAGVVYEVTATGQAPVADVSIYCDVCGADGHTWKTTDANGYYSFSGDLATGGGVWLGAKGPVGLIVTKTGYRVVNAATTFPDGSASVSIVVHGDSRLDIQLARQ
jgi:hypothetical protein